MKRLLQLPLHFQILIAMILGTVIGLVLNPGQTKIDQQISVKVQPADDGSITITETTADGDVVFRDQFASGDELFAAFPALGEAWTNNGQGELTQTVANPQLHLFNDGTNVSVRYSREHDNTPAVYSEKVALQKLESSAPYLYKIAAQQNGTVSQWGTTILKKIGDLFYAVAENGDYPSDCQLTNYGGCRTG